MKVFRCACGHRVFFDNDRCLACGSELGFDINGLTMLTLTDTGEGALRAGDGSLHRRCSNQQQFGNCNWLIPADDPAVLCPSCRLNDVIPALERSDNLKLWTRIERAKRRLLYALYRLGLPLAGQGNSLRFRFLEDRRRNPDVLESYVATAHQDGVITINISEADDAVRHAVREQMLERYRTVLGHLLHESGHFYYHLLVDSEALRAECRTVFGDERSDYSAALERYYADGAPPDWPDHYVSAYASAHPAEDFAETFAHFLHINEALETANSAGLMQTGTHDPARSDDWIDHWITLAIALNEILRSLGSDDPYPFVLTAPVCEKLNFIDRLVCRQVSRPDA